MAEDLRPLPLAPLGDRTDHYWLISRMAKLTGTDLVKAMDAAQLSQTDWAEMVEDCRGCDWSAGCERWLDRTTEPQQEAPGSCVNRARFTALKTALEALEEAEQ